MYWSYTSSHPETIQSLQGPPSISSEPWATKLTAKVEIIWSRCYIHLRWSCFMLIANFQKFRTISVTHNWHFFMPLSDLSSWADSFQVFLAFCARCNHCSNCTGSNTPLHFPQIPRCHIWFHQIVTQWFGRDGLFCLYKDTSQTHTHCDNDMFHGFLWAELSLVFPYQTVCNFVIPSNTWMCHSAICKMCQLRWHYTLLRNLASFFASFLLLHSGCFHTRLFCSLSSDIHVLCSF